MKIALKPKFNIGQEVKFRPGADFLTLFDLQESFTVIDILPAPCGCPYNLIDIGVFTKSIHAMHICQDCKMVESKDTKKIWINEKFLQPIDEEVLDTFEDPKLDEIINKFFL